MIEERQNKLCIVAIKIIYLTASLEFTILVSVHFFSSVREIDKLMRLGEILLVVTT